MSSFNLLVVDDSKADAELEIHAIRSAGKLGTWRHVTDEKGLRLALESRSWDAVLCDHQLPGFDSIAALRIVGESDADLPVIVVSGVMIEESASAVFRAGARDFVTKGNLARLAPALEREIRQARERSRVRHEQELRVLADRQRSVERAALAELARIAGSSLELAHIYDALAAQVAKILPFDRIRIAFLREDRLEYVSNYVSGLTVPGVDDALESRPGPLAASVLRREGPVLYDLGSEPGPAPPGSEAYVAAGLRSLISVPLLERGEPIAILSVSSRKPHAYDRPDVELAGQIGTHIANAIANARHLQAVERMSEERGTLAEISRVISASPLVAESFGRLATEVRKLVPWDRIVVSLVDLERGTVHDVHRLGLAVDEWDAALERPLEGTITAEVAARDAHVMLVGDPLSDRFVTLPRLIEAGVRSVLSVPLRNQRRVAGVLHLLSVRPSHYAPMHVRIAQGVADQIAGAIENSRLFENVERQAGEAGALLAIGRSANSELDLERVYASIAHELEKLVPYDRLEVMLSVPDAEVADWVYVRGSEIEGIEVGHRDLPASRRQGLAHLRDEDGAVSAANRTDWLADGPASLIASDLESLAEVTFRSGERVIGFLSLRSKKPNAFTREDLRFLKRVALQVAPAIENARLMRNIEQASMEREVLARIGRIVTSTPRVSENYEELAGAIRRVIPWDQLVLSTVDTVEQRFHDTYWAGFKPQDRQESRSWPLAGSITGKVVELRAEVMTNAAPEEALGQICPLSDFLPADVCSALSVPLVSGGRVTAVLHFRSRKPNHYSGSHVDLALQIGAQIAGAVENGRLYERASREARERTAIAAIGRAVSAEVELDRIYAVAADEISNLVEYDRLAITRPIDGPPALDIVFVRGVALRGLDHGHRPRASMLDPRLMQRGRPRVKLGRLPKWVADEYPELAASGLQSWMEVPIGPALRPLGYLSLRSRRIDAYDDDDVSLLHRVAAQVSPAISKALLIADLERRVLDRTESLQRAIRDLEAFAHTAAHDLRAPIRAIKQFVQGILESGELATRKVEVGEEFLDGVRSDLQRVSSACDRMTALIDDLLEYSSSGQAVQSSRRVDLTDLAAEVTSELRSVNSGRTVDVRIEAGLECVGDPDLLRTVLQNLIENAFKFTRPRDAAEIQVGSSREDGRVVFFVRDNGVGIDMRTARRLFLPFQRYHSASKFEGTGIGLATVRGIVERHGGDVWAESAPGMGATFYFTLPGKTRP